MPIKWIAARLHKGTTKSARSMLHRWMQQPGKSPCTQLQFQPMVDPFRFLRPGEGLTRLAYGSGLWEITINESAAR